MKIKTSFKECPYIDPEKEYEVIDYDPVLNLATIQTDVGRIVARLDQENGCAHLRMNQGKWEIVED